jgi:hypothetical protein
MLEALCRQSSTTLDIVHAEDGPPITQRTSGLAGAAGLIGLSAAGTAGYAAAIEPHSLVVTPYTLRPNGWPAGRRLTITVIADLHAGGPDMPLPQVQRIVDTANALKSDLIVMLGDYIARYDFAIERIPDPLWAAELARLQAPLGVWAILGITTGGTTSPACATRSLARRFRSWKIRRCWSVPRAGASGSPGSAIRSPTASVAAASAASTTCRERFRRSRLTIR